MTHDELLAKVKQIEQFSSYDPFQNAITALLAVVELHKPGRYEYFEKDICEHCTIDIDFYFYYPCTTIQAIEKKLK